LVEKREDANLEDTKGDRRITDFWDVTPCSFRDIYQEETAVLIFSDWLGWSTLKMQAADFSETLVGLPIKHHHTRSRDKSKYWKEAV
jgi:hypothetical protein